MNHPYAYTGFGLRIHSEIELPELLQATFDTGDISIRLGTVDPSFCADENPQYLYTAFRKDELLLSVPNVARYSSKSGDTILVDPRPGADDKSIRLFLLSIALPGLLIQRKKILLHASGILHNGGLLLFVGDSGAGKSSTAAALASRGYRVFSDDIVILDGDWAQDGEIKAYASYPMMKLWNNTIQDLKEGGFDTRHSIRPSVEKFGQFFHELFEREAYPIRKIFVLNPVDEGEERYAAKALNGIIAFENLSRHTYRRQFLHDQELQILHMKIISKLVQRIPVIQISRVKSNSDLDSFLRFLEQFL